MAQQKNSLILHVLSIIGGVLTAIFFLGFLLLSSILRSETYSAVIGSVLIISTLAINRVSIKPFLDAMNITGYIAGCILVAFGINKNIDVLFIILIGISIVTMLLSRGFILPFLSVCLFCIALFGEIANIFSLWYPLQIAVVPIMMIFLLTNLLETKILTRFNGTPAKYKPFHSGLFVSCLIALGGISIRDLTSHSWVISIFMWVGILIMVYRIMQVMEVKKRISQISIYLLSVIICLPTLFAPYLSGSLLLILICFYHGHKAECGGALLLFIYAISKYYYDLNITLLTKSITLFATGIAFIIAWYIITPKKMKHEEI